MRVSGRPHPQPGDRDEDFSAFLDGRRLPQDVPTSEPLGFAGSERKVVEEECCNQQAPFFAFTLEAGHSK
jgi:hypothetical protein